MNTNNNAVKKEKVDTLSDRKMIHPGGSSNQGKEQRMPMSMPVGPNSVQSNFNGVHLQGSRFGDDVFGNSPATASVPLASPSFAIESNTESPPLFRHTSPRPFQSPSRSLSMPATTRPLNFNQFNVRHPAQNPMLAYTNNYPGTQPLMPLHVPERYRPPNNPSHISSRFSGNPRCHSGAAPSYRTSADMSSRQPFTTSILPGASTAGLGSTNHSTEKEQKETTNTRKKRKACGHCEPCRRKENCGSCMNCINRAKGKQICVHRKCEVLKKKPGSASYSSSCNLAQEKRKDSDGGLFASEAKRNKNVDSDPTTPSVHSAPFNFTELGNPPRFSGQHITDLNCLPGSRPVLPSSSDSLSFLTPSTAFDQFCPPTHNLTGGSNSSLSVPIEDPGFFNQTFREIETSTQKTDQSSAYPCVKSETGTTFRNASLSHISELQPSVDENTIDCLWNPPNFPEKFASESVPHLIRQSSSTLQPAFAHNELQKPAHLHNEFLPVGDPSQTNSSTIFSPNFPSRRLSQNEVPEHDLTPSLIKSEIVQADSFFVQSQATNRQTNDSHDSVFDSDNQLLSSDMQMDSYNASLVNQLTSPGVLSLPTPEARNTPVSTPTSSRSLLHVNEMIPNGKTERKPAMPNALQPNYDCPVESTSSTGDVFQNTPPNTSQVVQNSQYQQFGLEQDDRLLDSLNAGAFLNEPFWNNPVPPTHPQSGFVNVHSDPGVVSGMIRPPAEVQSSSTFSSRKMSGNSADNFSLQRHLSVGSGSNNHSPMMQPPSSAVPISHSHNVLPTDNNLTSPINGLPAGSPLHPHMNSSPGPSASHISPSLVPNPSTPGHSNELPPASSSDFQANGAWQDQTRSLLMPTLNYQAHLAHSVSDVDSFGSKSRPESSLHANSVPNSFLAQPGSRLNSQTTIAPYHESTAKQNESKPHSDVSVSTAAARLTKAENELKSISKGPICDSQNKAVAQQVFTETMNSVLYGDTPLETVKTSDTHCSKSKSKAISEPAAHLASNSRRVESPPSEVHPTISPGESGYDSTEPSSVTSENSSQHSVAAFGLSDAGSINVAEPKNAYAALVGSKDQRALGYSRHPSSPIKAALSQASSLKQINALSISKSLNNLPQEKDRFHSKFTNSTLTNQQVNTPYLPPAKSRSLSLDSGFPEKPEEESGFLRPSKKPVPLRRYSHQEPAASDSLRRKVLSKGKTSSLPSILSPTAYQLNKNARQIVVEVTVDAASNRSRKIAASLPDFSTAAPTSSFESPIIGDLPLNYLNKSNISASLKNFSESLSSDDLRGRVISFKNSNGSIVKKTVFPQCNCLIGSSDVDDAPYYTHLGSARNLDGVRKLFENRLGFKGNALRIEKIMYTGKEGKTSHGCPIAKWIIRRTSVEEKVLVICRQRPGHHCAATYTVAVIMLWEGVERTLADEAYDKCTKLIPTHGVATERRCATNDGRTCACQGFSDDVGGASFSFGCSWSMYYNGCKYARSANPNKFKLPRSKDSNAESLVADLLQRLATNVSGIYKKAAPDAHHNQTEHEQAGFECRLGCNPEGEGRPFSGVTCCMDFCAHSHKDQHNMDNGTTVVVTLTKPDNRRVGEKPYDEQFHVLPLYRWDPTDDDGRLVGIGEKIKSGKVEILTGFRREVRLREKPLGTCKQRKERKRRNQFEGFVSPPKRRKGRKIKRSRSLEDVSVSNTALSDVGQRPCNGIQHDVGLPVWNGAIKDEQTPAPSHFPSDHHFYQNPPRWPYRRQWSVSHDSESSRLVSPSNLPSIGNIFRSSAEAAAPDYSREDHSSPVASVLTPTQSPSPHQFGHRVVAGSPHQQNYLFNTPVSNPFFENNLTSTSVPPYPTSAAAACPSFSPSPSISLPCSISQQICPSTLIFAPHSRSFNSHQSLQSESSVKSERNCDSYVFNSEFPTAVQLGSLPNHSRSITAYPVKQEASDFVPMPSASHQAPTESPPSFLHHVEREVFSDSEESFRDPEIGGVAIATCHGSVLIECAKRELHATTPLLKPNRFDPSRVSLVFYQHKNMNHRNHGAAEYEVKEAKRNREKAEKLEQEVAAKAEARKQFQAHSVSCQTLLHQINPDVTQPCSLHRPDPAIQPGLPLENARFSATPYTVHTNYSGDWHVQPFAFSETNTMYSSNANHFSQFERGNTVEFPFEMSGFHSQATTFTSTNLPNHEVSNSSMISESSFSHPNSSPRSDPNNFALPSKQRDNCYSYNEHQPLLPTPSMFYTPLDGSHKPKKLNILEPALSSSPSFSTDRSTQFLQIG